MRGDFDAAGYAQEEGVLRIAFSMGDTVYMSDLAEPKNKSWCLVAKCPNPDPTIQGEMGWVPQRLLSSRPISAPRAPPAAYRKGAYGKDDFVKAAYGKDDLGGAGT